MALDGPRRPDWLLTLQVHGHLLLPGNAACGAVCGQIRCQDSRLPKSRQVLSKWSYKAVQAIRAAAAAAVLRRGSQAARASRDRRPRWAVVPPTGAPEA